MEVSRKNFPAVMLDNDEIFFAHLTAVIERVDELCSMEITKKKEKYHFRIAPSMAIYIEPILYEVLAFINMFGIRLDLSKSMKLSSTVTFDIEL